MIIYIHSKKIRRISITKYIKPKRGFMKPTVLVSFIIFTPFSQMLLNTIHFASSNTALVICIIATDELIIADKELLHFFKTCRCSARLVGIIGGDIFILFCNDIAFNRVIPINTIILYESDEKTIADSATLLNLPAIVY